MAETLSTGTSLAEIQAILRQYVGAQLPQEMVGQFRLDALRWQRPQRSPDPHKLPIFFTGAQEETSDVQKALVTLGISGVLARADSDDKYHSDTVELAAVTKDTRGENRVLAVVYGGYDNYPAYGVDLSMTLPETLSRTYASLDRNHHITRFPTNPGSISRVGSYLLPRYQTNGYVTEAMVSQTFVGAGYRIPAVSFSDPQRKGGLGGMQLSYGGFVHQEYQVSGTAQSLSIGYDSGRTTWEVTLPRTLQRVR